MKLKDGQSNEVAIKQQAGAVANINIEQFADEGFDNVDSNSLALPFLKVLSSLMEFSIQHFRRNAKS